MSKYNKTPRIKSTSTPDMIKTMSRQLGFFPKECALSSRQCFETSAEIVGSGEGVSQQDTQYSWIAPLSNGDLVVAGDTFSQALFPNLASGYLQTFVARLDSNFDVKMMVGTQSEASYYLNSNTRILNNYKSQDDQYYFYIQSDKKSVLGVNLITGQQLQKIVVATTGVRVWMIYSVSLENTFILGGGSANMFVSSFNFSNFTSSSTTARVVRLGKQFSFKPISLTLSMEISDSYYFDNLFYSSGIFYEQSPSEPNQTTFLLSYDVNNHQIKSGYRFKPYLDLSPSFRTMLYSTRDAIDSTVRWWVQATQGFFTGSPLTTLKGPMFLILVRESNTGPTTRVLEKYKALELIYEPQFEDYVYIVGSYIDPVKQQFSVAMFIEYAQQITFLKTTLIGVYNFNQTGSFSSPHKIFYSSQNGFILCFNSFLFTDLEKGKLVGFLTGGQSRGFNYLSYQSFVIELPEPYYFSMGAPVTFTGRVMDDSELEFQTSTTLSSGLPIYVYFNGTMMNQMEMATISKPKQLVEVTDRKLTTPSLSKSNFEYQVGDPSLVISLGPCVYDQSCLDVTYKYELTKDDDSDFLSVDPDKDFIFSEALFKLFVKTSDATKIGSYNLKFKCSINDGFSNFISFTLDIKEKVEEEQRLEINLAPIFTDKIINMKIVAGGEAKLYLPSRYDPNGDEIVLTYGAQDEKLLPFLQLTQNQDYMIFNAGFKQLGDKRVYLKLTDKNQKPLSTTYWFTVTFFESAEIKLNNTDVTNVSLSSNIKVFVNDEKKFYIDKVTPTGEITINFEKSLNLTNLNETKKQILDNLIIKLSDDIDFTWELISLGANQITIKLNIENPILINGDGITSLQIGVKDPNQFCYMKTNSTLFSLRVMPPQTSNSDFLENIARFFNTTLSSLMISSVGMQILVSQSIQILWSFIISQQILSISPLLAINIPANLYYFFLLVQGSLKFDFMFTDDLISDTFQVHQNYPSYNDRFDNFGYGNTLVLFNLGFANFIFLFGLLFIVLGLILEKLSLRFKIFFVESYLPIMLSAILNLIQPNYSEDPAVGFSFLLAFIFFLACLSIPIIIFVLVFQKKDRPIIEKSRYKAFFLHLRQESCQAQLNEFYQSIRKAILIFSILVLDKYPVLQVLIFMGLSIITLIYAFQFKPIEPKSHNNLLILNELAVLLFSEFMVVFTNFVESPQVRYETGWFLLFVIFAVAIFNIAFVVADLIIAIRVSVRRMLPRLRKGSSSLLNSLKSSFKKTSWRSLNSSSSTRIQSLSSTMQIFPLETSERDLSKNFSSKKSLVQSHETGRFNLKSKTSSNIQIKPSANRNRLQSHRNKVSDLTINEVTDDDEIRTQFNPGDKKSKIQPSKKIESSLPKFKSQVDTQRIQKRTQNLNPSALNNKSKTQRLKEKTNNFL